MTIRITGLEITGLPSHPSFIRTDGGQYINLSTINLFHDIGGNRIEIDTDFLPASHLYITGAGATEAQMVAALKAAGFTIIEGLV